MSATERPLVKPRPVYLNLPRIRLPLPGIVSILHRVSGAVLFLFAIPVLLAAVGTCTTSAPASAICCSTCTAASSSRRRGDPR